MRWGKYLIGMWTGASLLAGAVAYLLVYGATGKLVIPHKTGAELVDGREAVDQLASWLTKLEGDHEESV